MAHSPTSLYLQLPNEDITFSWFLDETQEQEAEEQVVLELMLKSQGRG